MRDVLHFSVVFPGEREAVDVSGRSRARPGAHLSRHDVHELHVRFQSHFAQAPVQCMWQGTHTISHTPDTYSPTSGPQNIPAHIQGYGFDTLG